MTSTDNSSWDVLVERARRDDKSALGQLIDLYRSYVHLLVRLQLERRLRAKVSESDVVQQSCYEAVRDFPQFRGHSEAELVCWIRRIVARNLADTVRRYCKTKQRNVHLEQSIEQDLAESSEAFERALVSPSESPSEQASARERAVILSDALSKLPKQYREIVIRRNLEGQSFPEIAKEMGRSLDSVKNAWFRAFDQLRQLLKAAA